MSSSIQSQPSFKLSDITDLIKEPLNNYFNPLCESSACDIPHGSSFGLVTFGMAQILSVLTLPWVKDMPQLGTALKITGALSVTAGVTKKAGYLYLPALAFVAFTVLDPKRFASPSTKDFFKMNISLPGGKGIQASLGKVKAGT